MKLRTRTVEKVWGCETLPAPFIAPKGKRIGEIWFEPPEQLPQLLVKYLFTSDRLSVQCHPDDVQAEAAGLGRNGKEECWLVVAAETGAMLGVGFRNEVDAETMRAAAIDGSIEDLLMWYEVQAGDFFYIPANTVHAIGEGCAIIEIQQNSDVTYRLYDYGRPRELHLDEGVAIAKGSPHPPQLRQRIPDTGHACLVDGPHFTLDLVDGVADEALLYSYADGLLVMPLAGEVIVLGDIISPGHCAYASSLANVTFAPDGKALVTRPLTG